jgi:hypothetical protein
VQRRRTWVLALCLFYMIKIDYQDLLETVDIENCLDAFSNNFTWNECKKINERICGVKTDQLLFNWVMKLYNVNHFPFPWMRIGLRQNQTLKIEESKFN